MNKVLNKKSKKGFTLIELIVVLAILVVLAAIALPTFNGLIEDSKEKVANANARTVYTAARAYQAVNPGEITGTAFTDGQKGSVVAYLGAGFGDGDDTTTSDNNASVQITKITVASGEITKVEVSSDGETGIYEVK